MFASSILVLGSSLTSDATSDAKLDAMDSVDCSWVTTTGHTLDEEEVLKKKHKKSAINCDILANPV